MPTATSTALIRKAMRQPQEKKVVLRQVRQQVDHARSQQQPGRNADLWPASVKTTLPSRRVLDGHQHGAAPFTADANALEDAEQQQQDRRPNARAGVGRQQADQECGDTHDQERENEYRFATDTVPIVAEDDAPDRTREKTDEECRVRQQRSCQRVEIRKEQLVENDRRDYAIEEEVIPFDRRADRTCESDPADRRTGFAAFHCLLHFARLSGFR